MTVNIADDNNRFMREAIKEAAKAYALGECPIGCVIIKDGKVFVRSHNLRLTKKSATAHAEVLAIDKACRKLGDWRLEDCDMYVTLEPCTMCSGAIIQSRIRKVYFGAYEPKSGAVVSCNNIFDVSHGHNHKVEFEGGILENECSQMMLDFFRQIRRRDAGKAVTPPQTGCTSQDTQT
ncbi:MAG: nucleoside deaminase [Saccharofermentans sp.]|jgi:tRNA(adenine34) deaminase|nr:nucleoside deaminase [Mageeibacillus sp.]MCI1264669.1 nucleoside deaminase [Saccharofermentans sp.]MCI1275764.1 nucleoside deaminase [Saccharofermentans sp.]MCI1769811.1 nucleoside deaminase [Mageeibacillus sp.]MCI2044694.1 nucleoside deaminase [Mageeibacillus sp.]